MEDHRAIQLIQMMEEICVQMRIINDTLSKIVNSGSFHHERVGNISITDFRVDAIQPAAVSDSRLMETIKIEDPAQLELINQTSENFSLGYMYDKNALVGQHTTKAINLDQIAIGRARGVVNPPPNLHVSFACSDVTAAHIHGDTSGAAKP